MRVLLTGATGLLGGALLDLLAEGGHEPLCLVRRESPNASRLGSDAELVRGDAENADDLLRALGGVEAMVHVAGIEYAPQVIEACSRAGVERVVVVGSTSAHSAYEFRSGPKRRMEAEVRRSGLAWTIVRPTMIYGSERDKNMRRLLRFLDRYPVFPMFGDGQNLWQPVFYRDCARGTLEALTREAAVGQTYDLPGARPLTYRDLVETAGDALGRRPRIVPLPLEPVRRALASGERLGIPLPVGSEQVLRLREDKAYPYEKAAKELGYKPSSFDRGIRLEVARLRQLGMLRAG